MANQIIYISSLIAASLVVSLVYYMSMSDPTPVTPARQYIFSDPSTHKIPELDISMVKKHYSEQNGLVLTPSDSDYAKFSTPYAYKCLERPYVVFVPATYDHAKLVYNLIALYKQEFVILSGGHDYECGSISTKVVINTRLLNKIQVDFQNQFVYVGAGIKLIELYEAVKDSGYEVLGGYCPTVGVSGFTLGGGFNWSTSPFYGSGSQNVLEMRVILPSGYLVTVNWDNEYKDLMWGLLGAGGNNFGFVVEFKLKLLPHPEKKYTYFKQFQSFSNDTEQAFPLSMLSDVYRAWVAKFKTFQKRDNIGGTSVILIRDGDKGPNSYFLQVSGLCKNCSWIDELQDLRSKYPGYYVTDNKTYDNYYQFEVTELAPTMNEYPGVSPFNQPAIFTKDYTDEMITQQLNFFIKPFGYERGFLLEASYIKNSVKNPERTSFPYPNATWKFSNVVGWDDDRTEWQFNAGTYEWNKMMQNVGKEDYLGGYVNYKNKYVDDYAVNFYGGNLQRLTEIKTKYDANNYFQNPLGVPLKKDSQ